MTDPLNLYGRDRSPTTALKGLYAPSNAFLVGSGISLTPMGARALERRGVACLGINNAAGFVRCSAMVFSDPVKKFHHGIFFDPTILKFAPTKKMGQLVRAKVGDEFKLTPYRLRDCPSVFSFDTQKKFDPATFLDTPYASVGSKESGMFTLFLGLRLLHYLGVKRVFLAGVDFWMDPDKHYCYGEREQIEDFRLGNNEKYPLIGRMLEELRYSSFENTEFEVFNTNSESRLSCFPYVPFIEALDLCRGLVPKEPFDLTGWYDKSR